MKKLLTSVLVLGGLHCFGQSDGKVPVKYAKKPSEVQETKFFVNGQQMQSSLVHWLNRDQLTDVQVHNNAIYVQTKEAYQPVVLTLNEFKKKHTNLGDKPALFMVDGEIVKTNSDQYYLDEKGIKLVVVDEVDGALVNQSLPVIHITSIFKSKTPAAGSGLRIRGASYSPGK